MTATERVHRFRAKQRASKAETKHETKPSASDAARIRELEAELARERARRSETIGRARPSGRITRTASRRQEFGEIGKLRAENGKLKSDIIKLKAALAEEPDAAKLRKKVIDQQVEMAAMRRELRMVVKERDGYKRYALPNYRAARRLLTRATFNAIIPALHWDRRKQLAPNELAEAERQFIALKPLFIEAAS
jgi:hypothetical protein